MVAPFLRAVALLALILVAAPAAPSQGTEIGAETGAGPGALQWRAGETEAAITTWREALAAEGTPAAERARLAYNLGVAAHRAEDPLMAVAWFTACLRLEPRHRDAAANLEIARTDAELTDGDDGGPTAAVLGWARRFTRGEAEWLAVLAGVLLLVGGLFEAVRGRGARPVLLLALLLQPVLWTPLVAAHLGDVPAAHMVVEPRGLKVYPMPAVSSDLLGKLAAGDVVEALDELPGWRKVRFEGAERWVRDRGLAPLDL